MGLTTSACCQDSPSTVSAVQLQKEWDCWLGDTPTQLAVSHCSRSYGAFSLAGTIEVGFKPADRAQGDALPKTASPWNDSTVLFQADGSEITFGDYLARVTRRELAGKLTKEACLKLDVSEVKEFKFPFSLAPTTLRSIFNPLIGLELSHESMYPLACWHPNYDKIRVWLKESRPEFVSLLDVPILLHWGKNNPGLRALTDDGPGKSPWGHPDSAFWEDKADGPFGWRILSSAEIFDREGTADFEVMRALIVQSNGIYEHSRTR